MAMSMYMLKIAFIFQYCSCTEPPRAADETARVSSRTQANGKTTMPAGRSASPARAGAEKPPQKGVVLEFEGFGGRKAVAPQAGAGKNDRPWRKPAAAVKAEREASAKILGGNGGTHLDSVRLVMAVCVMHMHMRR